MREIVFRGKTKHRNEWEYGYYVVTLNEVPFIKNDNFNEVIPETVGQYTGLTDKNGTKIFEGDIVSGHLDDLFPEDESRYEIAWIDYGWHLTDLDGTVDTAEQDWVNQYFEVIGNIYDNPELVEVEK